MQHLYKTREVIYPAVPAAPQQRQGDRSDSLALFMHGQGDLLAPSPARAWGEQAGLILTTAHASPFSSPIKKKAYFLQGDDFAVLRATLPAARGFSRYLVWGTLKTCFSTEKQCQYFMG